MSSDEKTASSTDGLPEEIRAVHPFILKLWSAFVPGQNGETYWLPEEQIHLVYSGLIEFEGHDELPIILQQFAHVMVMMQTDFGSPSLAAQLLAILEDDEIQRIARNVKSTPQLMNLAERLSQFAGEEFAKTAPSIDEEKPEGSITVDQLKFPKRL